MAYIPKLDWKLDDTVLPVDMNRIETGVQEANEKPVVIIANNLTTTAPGEALDATQGKALDGKIAEVNTTVTEVRNILADNIAIYVLDDVGQAVDGAVVTIKKEDGTVIKTYTSTLLPDVIKIDAGISYTISMAEKANYIKPANYTSTAIIGGVTNVQMIYNRILRYGFKREKNNSDPNTRITYLFDAVSKNPAAMNYSTGQFDYGGWKDFCEKINEPVMLNPDGSVAYKLDCADQTKKADGTASGISQTTHNLNAIAVFKKFKWVKRYEDAADECVIFSNVQHDADYHAYAHTGADGMVHEEMYYGMFKGSNTAGKLRSLADQGVMVSQTRNTEVAYAQTNGTNWYTIYKSQWDYVADLLTLISKSDDSQTKFGTGRCATGNSATITTGTLKTYGQFKGFTDQTSDVKVFYIEGFWGNVWEGMAGMVLSGSKIKTKMIPPYNFDGAGYTDTGVTPSGTSGGFVNTASITDASGYVPKTANGSATTYFCDGLWFNNSQVDYALVSGNWHDVFRCGSRTVDVGSLASVADVAGGSRLSKFPA